MPGKPMPFEESKLHKKYKMKDMHSKDMHPKDAS